jgi:hypothetical protein
VLVLFSFCNFAVFLSCYNYLKNLPVPLEWNGVLTGLISVSAIAAPVHIAGGRISAEKKVETIMEKL